MYGGKSSGGDCFLDVFRQLVDIASNVAEPENAGAIVGFGFGGLVASKIKFVYELGLGIYVKGCH
jgi:hypothetical protein